MKLKTKWIKALTFALITALSMQPVLYASDTTKTEATVPASSSYTWDLTEFFKTKADWQAASKKIENTYIPQLASYKGKL